MGTISHQITSPGEPEAVAVCVAGVTCNLSLDLCVISTGVLEQAPDLGIRSLSAHRPCYGDREHPALRRIQQTEHGSGSKF